jgi:DNA repair exonuclease SbcCD ATPase subunit
MADLEGAAETALVKAKQLAEQANEAEEVLSSLAQDMEDLRTRIDTGWDSLSGDLRSWLARLQDEKNRLESESDEAGQALEEARDGTATAQAESLEDVQGAASDVSALDAKVDEVPPAVAQLVDQVEEVSRRLSEAVQEIEQQMERSLEAARQFLQDEVVPALESTQEAVQQRAQALGGAAVDECMNALQDKYENWLENLNEVEQKVEGAFQDAREHVTAVIDYCLDECARRHHQGLDEVVAQVALLGEAAESLAEAIATMESEVAQAGDSLGEDLDDTQQSLADMTAALEGVRRLLSSYGFVQA